jgi:hypothetical protein
MYFGILFASIVKMLIQQRNLRYSKLPSMVKGENQRNASVVGCELCKDHYVANPFTFTSVQVQVHGSSNRLTHFTPLKPTSQQPGLHET